MASPPLQFHRQSLLVSFVLFSSIYQISAGSQLEEEVESIRHRTLLGFKETPKGGNTTFDCSPSGPCVPCQYSEKKDENYRCSETGYRIPLKCAKIVDEAKETDSDKATKEQNIASGRDLHENVANKDGKTESYVTYRSCIPAVNEERLSVLGFEVLMLGLLLVSGSFVFLRRRLTATMPGAGGLRVQSNPRF